MNTYKVVEKWEVFKSFVSENLNGFNKNAVCYMHTDEEILIRATDINILKAIAKEYKIIKSESPDFFFDKESRPTAIVVDNISKETEKTPKIILDIIETTEQKISQDSNIKRYCKKV
jgi:hypothetical protein